jgi:Flp pilus assembly protein TadG
MSRIRARLKAGRRGRRAVELGQSLVELAVVLPLALLLLTASIDVGRIVFTFISLEDAVQEGSVYLANNPTATQAEIAARVQGSSSATEVANATVSIQSPCATTTMWVEASAPALTMLTPGGNQLFGSVVLTSRIVTTNLKGTCT